MPPALERTLLESHLRLLLGKLEVEPDDAAKKRPGSVPAGGGGRGTFRYYDEPRRRTPERVYCCTSNGRCVEGASLSLVLLRMNSAESQG